MPLLAAALPLIRSRGDPQPLARSAAAWQYADPAGELPAVALALDAEFVLRGRARGRVIPAADWFQGYLTTARTPR